MRKTGRSMLILITLGTVFVGSNTVNAQAKKVTWHRGTPKALRGNYKTKKYGADLQSIYKIYSKSTWHWYSGMPVQTGSHLYYRQTSHNHYVLKFNSRWYHGSKKGVQESIFKNGHALKIKGDSHTYYKY